MTSDNSEEGHIPDEGWSNSDQSEPGSPIGTQIENYDPLERCISCGRRGTCNQSIDLGRRVREEGGRSGNGYRNNVVSSGSRRGRWRRSLSTGCSLPDMSR